MTWESSLGSAIEVAIGIAGFAGIVSAVGRRSSGHWTEADQFRLRVLLTASGSALVFSFLPFILVDLIDSALAWRLLSATQALYMLSISVHRMRQASVAGIAQAIGMHPAGVAIQLAAVGLLVFNAAVLASPELYVFGVTWGLFVGFMAFVSLLLDTWLEEGS